MVQAGFGTYTSLFVLLSALVCQLQQRKLNYCLIVKLREDRVPARALHKHLRYWKENIVMETTGTMVKTI